MKYGLNFLMGRTVTVIFVGIVEAVFGAEEQAAYSKYDCEAD